MVSTLSPILIFKNNMKVLNDDRIRKSIRNFYSLIENDHNARYKSWEHCYKVFGDSNNSVDDKTIDSLCLNLAFYLASWGMYRGSSFLLQKDYKVHEKAVILMQQNKYNCLRGANTQYLATKEAFLLLLELQGKLEVIYNEIKKSVSKSKATVSDTLITKILMGVFGCVPAYDRYVKYTLKEYKIGTPSFTNPATRMEQLDAFYNSYKSVLTEEQQRINANGFEYPIMKVIDLLLWQIGFDDDTEGKLKKADDV